MIAAVKETLGILDLDPGPPREPLPRLSTPERRRLAGELYEESAVGDSALDVYLRYVEQYPEPVEIAVQQIDEGPGFKTRDVHDLSSKKCVRCPVIRGWKSLFKRLFLRHKSLLYVVVFRFHESVIFFRIFLKHLL